MKPCNCRDRSQCPLDGRCREETLVYQATISSSNNATKHNYIGAVEGDFKQRFYNHKTTFTNTTKRNTTALSAHYHHLTDKNEQPQIKWNILTKCRPYTPGSRKCDLCLSEKLEILFKTPSLNKRSELLVKCRHSTKWKLKNTKMKT